MKRQTAAACLLALTLVVSGCSSSARKDSAPVAVDTATPSATASPSASPEPSPSESVADPSDAPDVIEPPAEALPDDSASDVPDDLEDMLVPDDLKDVTADDMYGSGIDDLMAAFEAGDKNRKVGVCRTGAVIVSELTRTEIDERRASMTSDQVETLEDFIEQCGRVLAS
ncbi:hypothetical protein [Sanguibacter sp. Leaf3]|uniref:hypothetical protein n=1 Tax=Sanguibacter sp. Leaf3 TaxID=1736209 RepID=UPI0006FA714F|nr:hypothetical protein [Sanguibacter sp. Leaf3]KQT98563.1 hypothetical protein ASG53_13150 [Sanguibacter sp. Leaf3]